MGPCPDVGKRPGVDDCGVHPTFSLGRLAGVEIGINWSLAIVFALIVWSLEATVFPSQNPDLGKGTYVAMAFVAAVLFFASLLLHELGHAVQARRDGIEIEGITLWLFGGVARFRGELPSAGAELRMALAGPLVTAVLGSAFVLLAEFGNLPNAVDGVAAWLGYINLSCSSSTCCRRCRSTVGGFCAPRCGARSEISAGPRSSRPTSAGASAT